MEFAMLDSLTNPAINIVLVAVGVLLGIWFGKLEGT